MKRVVRAGSRRIEYELIRQARKDILIKALPEGVTRVYAPGYSHLRDVDEIVRARMDEILRMQDEVDRAWTESKSRNAMKDGRLIWFEPKPHRGRSRIRPAVHPAEGPSGRLLRNRRWGTCPRPDR